MAIMSGDRVVIAVNQAFLDAFALSSDDALGKRCVEIFHNGKSSSDECPGETKLLAGEVAEILVDVEETGRSMMISCNPIPDPDGGLREVVLIGTDVTELRRAEKELGHSEERFRTLIDDMRDGIVETDPDGRFIFVSRQAAKILGAESPDDLLGKPFFTLLTSSTKDDEARRFFSAVSGGDDFPEEIVSSIATSSGPRARVLVRPQPKIIEGRVVGIRALIADVTSRHMAERELRKARERYERLAEHAQDMVWRTDTEGTLIYVNEASRRFLGLRPSEAIGLPAKEAFTRESLEKIRKSIREAYFADPPADGYRVEVEHVRSDGQIVQAEINATLVRDENGRLIAIDGITRDISERVHAENEKAALQEQLRRLQKMEAIGRLAGGVAHDFNNLVMVLSMNLAFLRDELPSWDPRAEHVREAVEAARRAKELTRQLLAFSRQQKLHPKRLDLHDVVLGVEKMLRRLLGEHITLEIERETGVGTVLADPGSMEQVLMNLAVNARDAMPDGGSLSIDIRDRRLDRSSATLPPGLEPRRYVELSVADTGIGIAREVQSRVFEPFFTTKEQGKGTGLGLSTVYGIVSQSGGHVSVESVVGEGTTFHILLPTIDGPPESGVHQDTPSPEDEYQGTETVMVIEDDTPLRLTVSGCLERFGYNVLEAADGTEALTLAKEHEGDIHLLLSDVVMPGRDGPRVAEMIRGIQPNVRVLYMTGYLDGSIEHLGVFEEGVQLINKPFSPHDLLAKVREVCDE